MALRATEANIFKDLLFQKTDGKETRDQQSDEQQTKPPSAKKHQSRDEEPMKIGLRFARARQPGRRNIASSHRSIASNRSEWI
jgi:hypothetical protein